MGRILLIQSRERSESLVSERSNFERALKGLAELDCLSALDSKIAHTAPSDLIDPYDAFIFGGSAEFDIHGGREDRDPARLMSMIILSRVRMFMTYARAAGKPVLGICFGHQLIAEVYGGCVTHDCSQKKCGTYEVSLTEEGKRDKFFKNLPEKFFAQYAHRDSVTSLPEGAVQLADGAACRFSALRYDSCVYTMQFHPELGAAENIASLRRSVGYVPEGVEPESLVRESLEASQIIPLWFKYVVDGEADCPRE